MLLLCITLALFRKTQAGKVLGVNTVRDSVPIFKGSELVQHDHSWADLRTIVAEDRQQPGWPEHFDQLTLDYYKEWNPRVRIQPTVCVVSLYTYSLLSLDSWGAYAAEINLNWALSRGYKYSIFRKQLGNRTHNILWTKPRLVLFMLEQGELECKWVFSIDGDAVVNDLLASIETLQLKFLPQAFFAQAPSLKGMAVRQDFPEILMSCHWHYGRMGRCQKCKCFTSNDENACSEADSMSEFEGNSHCGINSGVYLLHNSGSSREMMRWWAGAGRGNCSWNGDNKFEAKLHLGEQKCSNRMKALFPKRINVVHAGIMNMPSWFSRTSGKNILTVDKKAVFSSHAKCFRTNVFVCHTLGLRDPRLRRRMFKEILSRRQGVLRKASSARREPYVELTKMIGKNVEWWVL
uniref:Hexosyltransferase n=1 Tax=Mantoniella antarctica TaxID=81844 RepID=A0A7S0X989_9CHLO|mmetsp:Transcript_27585/g.69054  ORF Transcript_27585/g.69054 Transcript_27585/m.69054 type:complete len:406 (+) Transcript_27585:59-1276(+)